MPEQPVSRTALARTYRPRRFAEMATQEHVSETLRAAVARGRTAHAYLFCGPRGVGKTTAARVLAMALNCPQRAADGEPCGECDSCERIWSGKTSLDVVEIDAASNRGVDDARDLRERAMYAPTEEHRFKVYIIDEAHMLTREAWNALLKILEEPPPRVIFVFATTEPQKIQQAAPPILSRCQRFDFRRISTHGIVERLRAVLQGEGITAEDDALVPIARRAEGGMRDALSLLDQVLSFAEGGITADDVRRVLGLVGEELYLELFDIVAGRRYADIFHFVQRVTDEGYDLAEFYRGLADALRALMVAKLEGADAADVREDLRPEYAATAARFGNGDLLRMLAMVAELDTEGKFRKSANPRTMLEALLLRWAFLEQTVDLEALLRATGGDAPPPLVDRAADPPRQVRAAPANASARARESAPSQVAAEPGAARSILRDLAAAPAPSGRERATAVQGGGAAGSSARVSSAAAFAPAAVAPGAVAPAAAATYPSATVASAAGPPQSATGESEPAPAHTSAATAPVSPLRDAERALRTLIEQRRAPHGLGIFLKSATIGEATADHVVLEVPAGPAFEQLAGESTKRADMQQVMSELLGRRIDLAVRSIGQSPAPGTGPAVPPARITPERVKQERLAALTRDHDALRAAVEHWDLELLE